MTREYKDSGIEWISKIPKEWNVVKLRNLGSFTASGIDKKIVDGEELVHIVNYVDVYNNNTKELRAGNYMLVSAPIDKCQEHQLKIGDMVYTPSSETIEDIGLSSVVMDDLPNTAYSYHVIRFRTHSNIYIKYKKYLTNNHICLNYFSSCAIGTIRKTISREIFKECKVLLPPLPEQKRIADYLDEKCREIDSLIALQEQMIEKLKAYKQSVITEAVTKGLDPNAKLVPSGIEWIGEIPEHWEVCRFKDIASVKANLVHPEDYLDLPQIAPDNIEKGSGRLLPYKTVKDSNVISDNHLFFKGQIVYSKIRPVLNKLIIAPFDGLCSADMYPIETKNYINYQKYFMLSEAFVSQVALVVQDRVKMPKINKDELSVIYVLSLPLSEQHSIASYLDTKCSDIDRLTALKQRKVESLKDYKKSIIYEAVTGKTIIE